MAATPHVWWDCGSRTGGRHGRSGPRGAIAFRGRQIEYVRAIANCPLAAGGTRDTGRLLAGLLSQLRSLSFPRAPRVYRGHQCRTRFNRSAGCRRHGRSRVATIRQRASDVRQGLLRHPHDIRPCRSPASWHRRPRHGFGRQHLVRRQWQTAFLGRFDGAGQVHLSRPPEAHHAGFACVPETRHQYHRRRNRYRTRPRSDVTGAAACRIQGHGTRIRLDRFPVQRFSQCDDSRDARDCIDGWRCGPARPRSVDTVLAVPACAELGDARAVLPLGRPADPRR